MRNFHFYVVCKYSVVPDKTVHEGASKEDGENFECKLNSGGIFIKCFFQLILNTIFYEFFLSSRNSNLF